MCCVVCTICGLLISDDLVRYSEVCIVDVILSNAKKKKKMLSDSSCTVSTSVSDIYRDVDIAALTVDLQLLGHIMHEAPIVTLTV